MKNLNLTYDGLQYSLPILFVELTTSEPRLYYWLNIFITNESYELMKQLPKFSEYCRPNQCPNPCYAHKSDPGIWCEINDDTYEYGANYIRGFIVNSQIITKLTYISDTIHKDFESINWTEEEWEAHENEEIYDELPSSQLI